MKELKEIFKKKVNFSCNSSRASIPLSSWIELTLDRLTETMSFHWDNPPLLAACWQIATWVVIGGSLLACLLTTFNCLTLDYYQLITICQAGNFLSTTLSFHPDLLLTVTTQLMLNHAKYYIITNNWWKLVLKEVPKPIWERVTAPSTHSDMVLGWWVREDKKSIARMF